ncbi:calcium-binding protein [Erythrobacter sp. GH1-10]|uniref:calcium-binding protein n=1 Tax=Erythrobacter sp. GH1-10 TaxID=3349334 RepID=UPI00387805BF
MRKTILTLTGATLALGGTGVALADHHRGKGIESRGPMAADTDGDGIITLAEAKAQGAERFARMDVNGDGAINREDREARRAARFAAADTDGNGELTAEEMNVAHEARRAERAERRAERQARRFERLDADNSGGLSEAELDAAKQARGEARAGHRGKRGEMRRGGRGGPRHHAMRMLRQADADGDKTVTRAEFDAAIEARFAKVDSDGSGTITAEERKAAMATMKERMQERRGKWRERRGQPES